MSRNEGGDSPRTGNTVNWAMEIEAWNAHPPRYLITSVYGEIIIHQ